MDPGHKASKNPSDNADLGFQAVGPALHIMQLNDKGLSAAKRCIIQSLAEIHHIDVICLQYAYVVLYRKQPAIPFHEASVQRILRVWMRSAKIY